MKIHTGFMPLKPEVGDIWIETAGDGRVRWTWDGKTWTYHSDDIKTYEKATSSS